jgi:hypothetical protein
MKLGTLIALAAGTLAVVAVVLASCGGGGKRLSYPQFQTAASSICLRYHRGLQKLGSPSSLPRIGRVARGAYRLGRAERSSLDDLRPPSDAGKGFSQFLDEIGAADALLPALWRAAEARDADRARTLVRQGRAHVAQANVHARAIGISDCRRS